MRGFELPPLPILRRPAWACSKCLRLFLTMEAAASHGAECKGDWLKQVAREGIGAERAELTGMEGD